jgi:diketogulonate reductase-like aldo/keto reductase
MIQGKVDHPVFLEIAEKVGGKFKEHGSSPWTGSVVFTEGVSGRPLFLLWQSILFARRFVPLPKSANSQRIRSNLDVLDFELDNEDMQKLDCLDRGKEGAVTWNPVDAP